MREGNFNEKIPWLVYSPKHWINNDTDLIHINIIKAKWDGIIGGLGEGQGEGKGNGPQD